MLRLLLIGAFLAIYACTVAHAYVYVCAVHPDDNLATQITQSAQNGCSTIELDSGAIYVVVQAIILSAPQQLTIRTSGDGSAVPARVNLRETARFLLLTNGAQVTVSNVHVHNAHAETHSGVSPHGGAFYASGEATRAILDRVAVFDSFSLVGHGGAVYVDQHAHVTATDCAFVNCSSRAAYGGAVALGAHGRAVFDNVTFAQNSAYLHGGALYADTRSSIACRRCAFVENSALEGNGGATYCEDDALFEFSDENWVCNNRAPKGLGGGSFAPSGLSLQWLPMLPTRYDANSNGGRFSNESSTANIALWPPYGAHSGFVESLDAPQDAHCAYNRTDERLAR